MSGFSATNCHVIEGLNVKLFQSHSLSGFSFTFFQVIAGFVDKSLFKETNSGQMREKAMSYFGIQDSDIIIEGNSKNTRENVVNCCTIIKPYEVGMSTVATDKYHAARFNMLMKRAMLKYAGQEFKLEKITKGIDNAYTPLMGSISYLKDWVLTLKDI